MSLSIEFNFVCEGKAIIGDAAINHCEGVFAEGYYERGDDLPLAWMAARDKGWHILQDRNKERHLCPTCWAEYLTRKK